MRKNLTAIMGTPVSSSNQGVLALGASLVNLCTDAHPGEVILLIGHNNNQPVNFRAGGKSISVRVVNYRLSPRSRPCDHLVWIVVAAVLYRIIPLTAWRNALSRATPWIAALEQAHLVGDIRGGDSFSDIYGLRRFLLGFMMAWTVLLVKGSIVQFPQTYGPYKSSLARWLAKYLLKRSETVIARDKDSLRVAQSLLGPNRKVYLSPDVAFSLEAIQPKYIELDPPINKKESPMRIGLNVNGLMFNGGYTRRNMFGLKLDYRKLLIALVETLLMEYPGEIWLVAHTYGPPDSVESDTEACRQIHQGLPEELKRRVRLVSGEYDQHEIKGVIGQCDFFIGSRMHACIAALSQGVPCVGVAYSMKFKGVFESVGMHDWVVDGRNMTTEQAISHIFKLYHRRKLIRNSLLKNANEARNRLTEIFHGLIYKHDR